MSRQREESLDEIVSRSAVMIADQIRQAAGWGKSEMDLQVEVAAAPTMALEAVAPLYERRLLPEEKPAVIDRRYSRQVGGGVQGNRHQRPAQARRPDAGPALIATTQEGEGCR